MSTLPRLREQTSTDALYLASWLADPQAEWKKWDAPYFHAPTQPEPRNAPSNERIIEVAGEVVGLVTRFPEKPRSGQWWELGILIYDPHYWGGGIGTAALREWTNLSFAETGAHVLTLTTWSGNERMIRAALRVGYAECARVREARVVEGQRYDSVRLDILRREWQESSLE